CGVVSRPLRCSCSISLLGGPAKEATVARHARLKATIWGLVVMALLAILIVAGSRNLAHFDAALVGYTFATLFATFGITYRYSMWLQRPPTRLYWRRGWQLFLNPAWIGRNLMQLGRRLVV